LRWKHRNFYKTLGIRCLEIWLIGFSRYSAKEATRIREQRSYLSFELLFRCTNGSRSFVGEAAPWWGCALVGLRLGGFCILDEIFETVSSNEDSY
jgi:hypothetical protein